MSYLQLGPAQTKPEDVNKYHFTYIRPDEQTQTYLERARTNYWTLLNALHSIPESRERSLAITNLETSLMYTTKAIIVAFEKAQKEQAEAALDEIFPYSVAQPHDCRNCSPEESVDEPEG